MQRLSGMQASDIDAYRRVTRDHGAFVGFGAAVAFWYGQQVLSRCHVLNMDNIPLTQHVSSFSSC